MYVIHFSHTFRNRNCITCIVCNYFQFMPVSLLIYTNIKWTYRSIQERKTYITSILSSWLGCVYSQSVKANMYRWPEFIIWHLGLKPSQTIVDLTSSVLFTNHAVLAMNNQMTMNGHSYLDTQIGFIKQSSNRDRTRQGLCKQVLYKILPVMYPTSLV